MQDTLQTIPEVSIAHQRKFPTTISTEEEIKQIQETSVAAWSPEHKHAHSRLQVEISNIS